MRTGLNSAPMEDSALARQLFADADEAVANESPQADISVQVTPSEPVSIDAASNMSSDIASRAEVDEWRDHPGTPSLSPGLNSSLKTPPMSPGQRKPAFAIVDEDVTDRTCSCTEIVVREQLTMFAAHAIGEDFCKRTEMAGVLFCITVRESLFSFALTSVCSLILCCLSSVIARTIHWPALYWCVCCCHRSSSTFLFAIRSSGRNATLAACWFCLRLCSTSCLSTAALRRRRTWILQLFSLIW